MKQQGDPDLNLPSFASRPGVDPINEGLWRSAAEGRLAIHRCSECGVHRYPPAHVCHECGSWEWSWDTLPGTGTVFSYVWLPDPARSPEGGPLIYANVAVIELDGTQGPPCA